ncbi:hypothetical protein ACTTAL_05585 [Rhodobacter capsulatus]|uniref:hypothetical protein n=1 Tax=Rhodobacter capsulatus TaxID=1061 RepID=UPI00103FBA72|nr:hypothetical protein [Rhodobacter capsulatus]
MTELPKHELIFDYLKITVNWMSKSNSGGAAGGLHQVVRRCALNSAEKRISEEDDSKEIFFFYGERFSRAIVQSWLYNDDASSLQPPSMAYGSYVFLLHKNISITNISLPEISALLRLNLVSGCGERLPNNCIQIFSSSQYEDYISKFLPLTVFSFNSEADLEKFRNDLVERTTLLLSDFLLNTIAVTHFATSIVVHIPRSLRFDLMSVVAESGYIHSAGYQVYVAKCEKSHNAILTQNLENIYKIGKFTRPLLFAPYCEEFFPDESDTTAYSIKDGLDDIKLSARKHYIGSENILDLMNSLPVDKFKVPRSQEFLDEISGQDPSCAIFLYLDRGLEYSKTQRTLRKSDDQYTFCLLQFVKSANKLSIIKERKPGWTGPVTIPHTLSSSIVNISRRLLELTGCSAPIVVDPFCGSSTFLIDYALRDKNVRLIGVDRHPLFHQVNRDNFDFLSNPQQASNVSDFINALTGRGDELNKSWQKKVHDIASALRIAENRFSAPSQESSNEIFGKGTSAASKLADALALILSDISRSRHISYWKIDSEHVKDFMADGTHFDRELVNALANKLDLSARVGFYFCWRAISTYSYRLESSGDGISWLKNFVERALKPELEKVSQEMRDIKQIEESQGGAGLFGKNRCGAFEQFQGAFTGEIRLSSREVQSIFPERNIHYTSLGDITSGVESLQSDRLIRLIKGDSIEFLRLLADRKEGSIQNLKPNLIITDPPYNFNINESGGAEMQRLFFDLVDLLPKVLAPKGIAAIVVPSFSRNGQSIPFYQSNEVFTRRMFAACAREGRRLIMYPETQPSSVTFPQYPYRWNSRRGVSRFVMIFVVE